MTEQPKTLFDFLLEARREIEAKREEPKVIDLTNERKRRRGMDANA